MYINTVHIGIGNICELPFDAAIEAAFAYGECLDGHSGYHVLDTVEEFRIGLFGDVEGHALLFIEGERETPERDDFAVFGKLVEFGGEAFAEEDFFHMVGCLVVKSR